jgi:hypothetical protein
MNCGQTIRFFSKRHLKHINDIGNEKIQYEGN